MIGVAVALGVVLTRGGGTKDTSVAAAMRAAGCTFQAVPSQRYPKNGGSLHIVRLSDKVKYNSYPPSSGYHYPVPAVWGNYTQPVNPKQAVHNEEHGGVVVWYGAKTSQADRQKIDQFYSENPNGMLVTPLVDTSPGITYPPHEPLGSKIALTAWAAPNGVGRGVVAICPSVNPKAFEKFRDAFRGRGPESSRIPTSSETPGS